MGNIDFVKRAINMAEQLGLDKETAESAEGEEAMPRWPMEAARTKLAEMEKEARMVAAEARLESAANNHDLGALKEALAEAIEAGADQELIDVAKAKLNSELQNN